jgi:hypothetical protein
MSLIKSKKRVADHGEVSANEIAFIEKVVRPMGAIDKLDEAPIPSPPGIELLPAQKSYPAGTESLHGFSPHLSWFHYRALMRVENVAARDFYEREAAECGWSKVQLERQIHSFYYDRIVANRGVKGLLPEGRERLPGERVQPSHLLKSHYNLDAIIAAGYRVNSRRATAFRQWATGVLRDYTLRGYVMDRKRMENGAFLGEDYFERLLEEIREIRLSERRFYQKITDIYATAMDYDRDAPITQTFFAKVQNKMHYAVL